MTTAKNVQVGESLYDTFYFYDASDAPVDPDSGIITFDSMHVNGTAISVATLATNGEIPDASISQMTDDGGANIVGAYQLDYAGAVTTLGTAFQAGDEVVLRFSATIGGAPVELQKEFVVISAPTPPRPYVRS